MNLTPKDLCVQLGRFLASATSALFVEAEDSTPGTIYASELPPKAHRLTPACAIVPQPSAGDEVNGMTQRLGVVLHAEAISNQAAMEMLQGYQSVLVPNNRSAVLTQDPYMPGVVGVPAAAGTHTLWRIIWHELTQHPTPTPRSPGGLAVAEMALDLHAVPTIITVTEE